jgi:hypothetical protein
MLNALAAVKVPSSFANAIVHHLSAQLTPRDGASVADIGRYLGSGSPEAELAQVAARELPDADETLVRSVLGPLVLHLQLELTELASEIQRCCAGRRIA